ncbi:MAG TPA: IS481 family transposase [Acidimicrobiales bacterium]|nr:IS481 family transposase [Acidimicrobiales bacterium]
MDLSEYVITEVLQQGRSVREVAAAHGISKTWLYELLARHRAGGTEALVALSRRPLRSPSRLDAAIEDEIVELRKTLAEEGLDAGAATIQFHLRRRHRRRADQMPSVATIWRVLKRRGFVTAQPQKRPRSSWKRFQADLPNECWQADVTHWTLKRQRPVEILNIIDDHSRLLVASVAFINATSPDVVAAFQQAARTYGTPASMLTDNGAIFTAEYRNGRCSLQSELIALGVEFKHSRPYHPQTCGKIERFHQTLKKWLDKQPPAATLETLQANLDRFAAYYNTARPHRAIGRRTPTEAFTARSKAHPKHPPLTIEDHYRVRRDRVDKTGRVTLRYRSKLHHIGIGREHAGTPILLLIHGPNVRIITQDGEILRELTLDPNRNYQPSGRPRGRPRT